MAKFCGNCGTQLDDDAKVCGNCGMPVDEDTDKNCIRDPEKQKKTIKTVKIVLAAAVIIVVAVIAINTALKFTGYNGLLRKVMTAYEKYDIDTLVSLSGDMYFYGGEDWVEDYFEYSVGNSLDYFESSVGHSCKLSYKIDEIYTLSGRKLNDTLEGIEYAYPDFDVSTIKKIVVADLTVKAKQGGKSAEQDISVVMSKESGKWKLLYIR